ELMSREIGDPCHDKLGAAVVDHDVLIEQDLESEPPELGKPWAGAAVVLVVACDEERAELRLQAGEWRNVLREVRNRAVHQVARDGDDVRLQAIHPLDDGFDIVSTDRVADMDV